MEDAHATKLSRLRSCDPPFSFFQLVDELVPRTRSGTCAAAAPLHRFFSLMRKMGARSFLREEITLNNELIEERDQMAAALNKPVSVEATRITMFRRVADRASLKTIKAAEVLAYIVVMRIKTPRSHRRSYVYEAVVRPPSLLLKNGSTSPPVSLVGNYYIHSCRRFKTSIGTKSDSHALEFLGSYFAQQNAITHVCAHAALRMAVNSSPLFSKLGKLTSKRINDILNLPWEEVRKGLDHQQMKQVIKELGGTVQFADFYARPSMEYDQFVYPLMESGCPVILNVHGRSFMDATPSPRSEEIGHALTVLGHTMNTDRWEPEARGGYGSYPHDPFLQAAAWTDHLIISDDNFGMFVTLPTDSLRNLLIPDKNPALHAAVAMGIVPKGVRLSGYMAERRAASVVQDVALPPGVFSPDPYWLRKLREGPLVCRTLLQTRSRYIQHLRKMYALINQAIAPNLEAALKTLPPKLWVTELTISQLYGANRTKVGEALTNAGASVKEHESGKSFVALRLPGYIVFFQSRTDHTTPITGHTPLIVENDATRLCDW